MSTILDALRKAQEDTGGKRQPPVGEHPATTEAMTPAPRRRRRVGWPVAVLAILAVAFAGGLALGDRIVALFGGPAESPSGEAEIQVAAHDEGVPEAAGQPAAVPGSDEEPATAAAPTPIVRRGNRAASADGDASRPVFAQTADSLVQKRDAAPAAAPVPAATPYGQLHVFGAGEAPVKGKPSSEDRLARLQQLREKMQQARQKAAGQGRTAENAAPTQIFVPPPRDAAPAAGEPEVPAPAAPAAGKADAPAPAAPVAEPVVEVARAADPAPVDVARPAAPGGAAAIGVSVSNAHDEAAQDEIRDTDVPEPQQVPAAEANTEPPTVVAAIAPDPAPQAVPAPAAAQPVLRRAPGGAPQVAINILQWSTEPARRFAFVSVDGGNMTQVREGDHIGGLTIKHIHQQMIEFGFNDSTFLLRAN